MGYGIYDLFYDIMQENNESNKDQDTDKFIENLNDKLNNNEQKTYQLLSHVLYHLAKKQDQEPIYFIKNLLEDMYCDEAQAYIKIVTPQCNYETKAIVEDEIFD